MTLYRTSNEQKAHLQDIATKMSKAGLRSSLVAQTVELASISEGVYELVALWEQFENDPVERDHVLGDIQEALDENARRC